MSLRRKVSRYKRSLLLLLAAFILVELVLHLLMPYPEFSYFYTNETSYWDEDPELFWVQRGSFAQEKHEMKKRLSQSLVYTFGGSILTSHGADTNFPDVLGHCLGDDFSVINFGTGGYTSHQSLILYRRMIQYKKPGVVVFCHGFNDMGNAPASDIEMAGRNAKISTHVLYYLSKSRLVSLWRKLLRPALGNNPYQAVNKSDYVVRVPVNEFRENLKQVIFESGETDFPLVFLSQASPDRAMAKQLNDYFTVMEDLAKLYSNVYYLDIREVFNRKYQQEVGGQPMYFDQKTSKLLFVDLCHLNNEGHKLAAQLLCDFLKTQGLVKSQDPVQATIPAS